MACIQQTKVQNQDDPQNLEDFINIVSSNDYDENNESWSIRDINDVKHYNSSLIFNNTIDFHHKESFDLSSPREWLEYNEIINRDHGAYTVLRCDVLLKNNDDDNNNRSDIVKLWGKEFHLNRLENSFLQMKHSEDQRLYSTNVINLARLESEIILNRLINDVIGSCYNIDKDTLLKNNTSVQGIKIAMITLLWTESTNKIDESARKIEIQGHAFCSNNSFFNPAFYNPSPITVSIATQMTPSLSNSLPTRYNNLPEAKISSWCRIRRQLEIMYKREGIGEVLLTRQKQNIDQESVNAVELLEGLTSNLFIVYKDGSIHTSKVDSEVLGGYARYLVIKAAKQLNMPVVIGPINLQDGSNGLWMEAFTTSSIRLIAPIGKMVIPKVNCNVTGRITEFRDFWSEVSLDVLPWVERRWFLLYQAIQHIDSD